MAGSFLDRWGGFVSVAAAVALGFIIASVPTPLYPLYQAEWQLPPSALSYIFTAYMAGLLVAFLCFGSLSDSLGRLLVVLAALAGIAAGLLLSALAAGVVTLVVARACIGLANGALTMAAAMALTEAHPRRDRRMAAVTTSAAITAGFGLGPVVGGGLAQIGLVPLRLPYLVLFGLMMANMVLVLRSRTQLRGPHGARRPLSIRPRMAMPGRAGRPPFFLAALAGFSASAAVCLFASLVPSLLQDSLPWRGPLVIGSAFLLLAGASATTQIALRRTPPFIGLALGMCALLLGLLCLAVGVRGHGLVALAASMLLTGVGQGFGIMDATIIASRSADEANRAANVSTFFFIS